MVIQDKQYMTQGLFEGKC